MAHRQGVAFTFLTVRKEEIFMTRGNYTEFWLMVSTDSVLADVACPLIHTLSPNSVGEL